MLRRWALRAALAALLGATACARLPGQGRPLQIGPLRFGLTLAEMEQAFAGRERTLDSYDTPLGETWTIVRPFAAPPEPAWLTADVDRVALTFWDGRLVRLRLHYPVTDLARAAALRKRFDRGYRLAADLTQGEHLFLEYHADDLTVFLSGGDENVVVAFVDVPAYYALDASRRRLQQKAEGSFTIEGLRFGAGVDEAKRALGGRPRPSDFFAGLQGFSWRNEAAKAELILGFAPALGLSAGARLYEERWPAAQVQQKLWELTRAFGQGRLQPTESGRTLTIDVGALRVALMVIGCEPGGCMVSEGWLWTGPSPAAPETPAPVAP